MAATRSDAKHSKAKQSSKAPKSSAPRAVVPRPSARLGPGRLKKTEQPQPKSTAFTTAPQGTLQADIKRKINTVRALRAALSNFRGMLTRTTIGSLVDNELVEDVGFLTKRASAKLIVLESEEYWMRHMLHEV